MWSSSVTLLSLFLLHSIVTASAKTFNCTGPTRSCSALIGFVPANSTTFSHLKTLFQVKSIPDLLAANDLPATTPHNKTAPAGSPVRIPIPCSCSNGTGTSSGRPVYSVKKDDGLDYISRTIFGGFITYQEVARANNVTDPNKIEVKQKLLIPLPCSCDAVGGKAVVHYAHKVVAKSTVAGIAAQFGITEEELLTLNGIADPKSLQEEQILDVPISACSSFIKNDSPDHGLLVPNGSYALTANKCVQCSCASNSSQLQCVSTHGFNSSTCPAAICPSSNLTLGQSLAGSSVCNSTLCSYAGYGNQSIFTVLANISTCSPGSSSSPSPSGNHANRLVGWRILGWMELLLIIAAFFSVGCL